MDEKIPDLYDLQELKTIAAGDEQFYLEMISLFISQNESAIAEINMAIPYENWKKIVGILHKMKPSIIVMGVTKVGELIQQIENLEMSIDNQQVFNDLVKRIETILTEVNFQLKQG